MPSVSRVPQTSRTPISRITYGSAPMWSSCPCRGARPASDATRRVAAGRRSSGSTRVDARHLVAGGKERPASRSRCGARPARSRTGCCRSARVRPRRDDAYDVAHAAAVRPRALERRSAAPAHCLIGRLDQWQPGRAPRRSPMSSSAALSGIGLVGDAGGALVDGATTSRSSAAPRPRSRPPRRASHNAQHGPKPIRWEGHAEMPPVARPARGRARSRFVVGPA